MFYQDDMDSVLRFGDVLEGYVAATPCVRGPILETSNLAEGCSIDVALPSYCVVISPCCAKGYDTISLTPLTEVRDSFFDNPHLEEDLTIVNRRIEPEHTVSPHVWDNVFSEERRQRRMRRGRAYVFLDLFVYAGNVLFPPYTVHRRGANKQTKCRMIDFRNIYRLDCEKIRSPDQAPLKSKILQLSAVARSELRDKIAYYYYRPPEEDLESQD